MMSHAPNHFNNNFSSMSCGFPGPSMHRMMPYDMMHGHHGSFFNPSVRFCDPSPMPLSSSSSSMSFNSYNNSSNNKMNNLSSGKERAKVLFRDILGKSSKSYRDMFLMNEPSFLQLANYAEFNQNDPSDAASSSSKSSIKSTSSSSSSSSSIESIRAQQYPFSKPLSAPSTSITSGPSSSSSSSSSSAMVLGSSTTPHRNNVHTPQSQPYGTKKVDVDPKILVSTTSLSTNATSSASITSTTSSSRTGKTKSSSRNDTRFKRFTNRLRTTCDRCTRLKTKCTREHDSDACSRCARGNFQCVFTNQRKRGRVPRSFLQNGHSSSTTFSSSDHDSYLGGSSQHDQSSIGTRDDQGRYIIHDDDDDDDYREEDDEEEISEYEHHPKKVRIVNVKPLNN